MTALDWLRAFFAADRIVRRLPLPVRGRLGILRRIYRAARHLGLDI